MTEVWLTCCDIDDQGCAIHFHFSFQRKPHTLRLYPTVPVTATEADV